MKPLLLILLTLFINSFADTTWVEGRVSGIWSTDGNPYILTGDSPGIFVVENDTLTIEPGVEVLFEHYHVLEVVNATLIAEGTADDSILFRDIDDRSQWSQIFITGNSNFSASFSEFRLRGGGHFDDVHSVYIGGRESSATLSHCTLLSSYRCLDTVGNPDVLIIDCYFRNMNENSGIEGLRGGLRLLQRCVIYGVSRGVSRGEICNSWMGSLSAYDETSVYNNILVSHRNAIYGSENVRYNCFQFNDQEFENVDIEGIGILDRVNDNGDSTDRFGNLFQDPLQVGPIDSVWIYPDSYYLTEDSPCIDAGDPESDPDPDGTRADMGAFFFPQQNICIEQEEIEFVDVQTNDVSEADLEIFNIGVQNLIVNEVSISPEDSPFSIGGDDCFVIRPDSSYILTVYFNPPEQGSYEALLTIESNDRDQGELEIPITGSALSVSDESIDIPGDFVLFDAFPNPFNSVTRIDYTIPPYQHISLSVFDVKGRFVCKLAEGAYSAGRYSASFDASMMPAGLYIIRLDAGGEVLLRKVVLVK